MKMMDLPQGDMGIIDHTMALQPTSSSTLTYIKNYAEANGILLPGRIPGFKRTGIQLLPTQTTKRSV